MTNLRLAIYSARALATVLHFHRISRYYFPPISKQARYQRDRERIPQSQLGNPPNNRNAFFKNTFLSYTFDAKREFISRMCVAQEP